MHQPVTAEINRVADVLVDSAFFVHRTLGPGLLESVYEQCLAQELRERGLHVDQQKPQPVIFKQVRLEAGYRIDLLVERAVIVEIKSVEALAPVHTAQLLTYMRLADVRLGYLLNFNVALLKDGLRRHVL